MAHFPEMEWNPTKFTISTGSLSNDPNTAWDVTVSRSTDPMTPYNINGPWLHVSILSDTPHQSTQLNINDDNNSPHSLPTIHHHCQQPFQPCSTSDNTPSPPQQPQPPQQQQRYESHGNAYEDEDQLETDYHYYNDPIINPPPSSPPPPPPPQYIGDTAMIPPHQHSSNEECIPSSNPTSSPLLHPISCRDNNKALAFTAPPPHQHIAPPDNQISNTACPLPIPLPVIDTDSPITKETTTPGTALHTTTTTTTTPRLTRTTSSSSSNSSSSGRRHTISNSPATTLTSTTTFFPRHTYNATRKGTTPKLQRLLTPRCPPAQFNDDTDISNDNTCTRKSPSQLHDTDNRSNNISDDKRPAWSNVFNHVRSLSGGPPRPLCTFHHRNGTFSHQQYNSTVFDAVRWTPGSPPPRPRRSSGNSNYREYSCTTSHSFSPEGHHHMHVGISSLGADGGGRRRRRREGASSTREERGGMRSSMGEYNTRGGVGGILPTVGR